LRCLQSTEKSTALLPIALTYEHVPERDAFARELAGEPKQKMRLGALLSWVIDAWRGRVDLGRIHIACGAPVLLDASSDVHAVSHEIIDRLRDAMLTSDIVPDGSQQDDDEPDESAGSVLVEVKSAR
jgi:glycerol-3-phosphate O-acyltransferase